MDDHGGVHWFGAQNSALSDLLEDEERLILTGETAKCVSDPGVFAIGHCIAYLGSGTCATVSQSGISLSNHSAMVAEAKAVKPLEFCEPAQMTVLPSCVCVSVDSDGHNVGDHGDSP